MHTVAREHVNIPEYTEHFRAYTDLGNKGATKCGVNDTYSDTIIPRAGAIVTINVGLAQVRPNKFFSWSEFWDTFFYRFVLALICMQFVM